jgi:hypothetical protein
MVGDAHPAAASVFSTGCWIHVDVVLDDDHP